MQPSIPATLLSIVLGSILAPHGSAGVVVVDPAGSPGGPVLQAAIDASQSGDILLVRAGNYLQTTEIAIDNKALTLINDTGATVVLPQLRVLHTALGASVVVRGFTVGTGSNTTTVGKPGILLQDNPGTVWIEECIIKGGSGWDTFPITTKPGRAIDASNSASIVVERCSITAAGGFNSEFFSETVDGGAGIVLTNSRLSMHDTDVAAGKAGFGSSKPADHVGGGLVLKGSIALAARCTLTGGATNVVGAESEPGVEVCDVGSLLYLRDCLTTAGAAPNGVVASAQVGPAGTILTLSEPAASFSVSSPHRAGEMVHIEVEGTPGDLAATFTGLIGAVTFLPLQAQGTFVLSAPALGPFALAPIPASGVLTIDFPAPPLPASITSGFVIAMEAAVLSAPGTLEAASIYVQVDSSF